MMASEWIPTNEELRLLDYWFRSIDRDNTGVVGGIRIVNFLRSSGALEIEQLKILWDLVDTGNTGAIYRKQFYKLIRLVTVCLHTRQPPSLQLYLSTVHYAYPLPNIFSVDQNILDGISSAAPQQVQQQQQLLQQHQQQPLQASIQHVTPQYYRPAAQVSNQTKPVPASVSVTATGFGAAPPILTMPVVTSPQISTKSFGSPVPAFPLPQVHTSGNITHQQQHQQQPVGYPRLGEPTQPFGGYAPAHMQPVPANYAPINNQPPAGQMPLAQQAPPGYYYPQANQPTSYQYTGQPAPIQPVPTQPYTMQLPNPTVNGMQPVQVMSPITPAHSIPQQNHQQKPQIQVQAQDVGPAIVYEKGKVLSYDKNNGVAAQVVTVVGVHKDDFPNVYYTIKFANGDEKQTEFKYLKVFS